LKILFLDIDGVLNIDNQERDCYGHLFHKDFVENLRQIIYVTGAFIVISSSWRKSGLKTLQEMWKVRELPGEVIDVTPSIYTAKNMIQFWNGREKIHPTPKTHNYSIPRGCEIEYWLKDHDVENYCIIDDDSDMLWSQRYNFVRTFDNFHHEDSIKGLGLTKNCALQAIDILKF